MTMNISSPRSVCATSIDETIAIITPKKLCLRTPSRTSSRLSTAFGPEGVVIRPQQCLVVIAAQLVGQRTAEEVRDVGHRRTPRDGLPVHHGQRPVGAGLAEKHVVQAIVTVHQAVRALLRGFACDVSVEACHQPLAHLAMCRGDLVAVAL